MASQRTAATHVKEQAKQGATQAATQAKEATQQTLSGASEQARTSFKEQLGQRSSQAGGQVSDMAESLHAFASQLRDQGKDSQARLADQAADRVDRLGHYLSDADPDRLLADAERFGRRQPWAVAAGGLVLGIAAARMLKASSERRYAQTYARDHSQLSQRPPDYPGLQGEGPLQRDPFEEDPYALTRATPPPTADSEPSVEETRPLIGEW
jgi:hypothetical protein